VGQGSQLGVFLGSGDAVTRDFEHSATNAKIHAYASLPLFVDETSILRVTASPHPSKEPPISFRG
jgi:hypothetical protein